MGKQKLHAIALTSLTRGLQANDVKPLLNFNEFTRSHGAEPCRPAVGNTRFLGSSIIRPGTFRTLAGANLGSRLVHVASILFKSFHVRAFQNCNILKPAGSKYPARLGVAHITVRLSPASPKACAKRH
jgi:hypothetical protein